MKTIKSPLALLLMTLVMIISGCASSDVSRVPMHESEQYYNYLQPTFEQYVETTTEWLRENRAFITDRGQHEIELVMNAPYSKGDPNSEKAILLAHGLGDSPFSFSDISDSLAEQGFYVQVVLLPGHGSNPKHMKMVNYQDWQIMIDHYAELLKQQYDEVWLGGFSTGGNLVSIHTLENQGVDGLMLFSPGFQTRSPVLEKLTPLAAIFTEGWFTEESNLAKYNSGLLVSALAYSESAKVLRNKIADQELDIPVMLVVSEADSVIDANALNEYFDQYFTHTQSRLVWYGESTEFKLPIKVERYSMQRDDLRISTASHMSSLFAPDNSYYGQDGDKIICENSLNSSDVEACNQGEQTWFSAWGYTEGDRIYARLTWNPYYAELEKTMKAIAL
ncbi:phospholipase [Marinomonas rhizomae]|uniref:Esterase/lipase n=1 Tax=Marinomonas rhizomae TaxID=491948 RepID=A0A366JAW4_9GAMM|nr:alpha/beta fold hydrolase [Marinomonas rhizomae]RBP83530.1 esterase/lipase [Marinomonas rhizomae]RNF74078.1 phospholipase [Marinomonas rhizomae]